MAVKSIIDIQLNDGKFREFQRLYDKYQTALKSAPAAWALVNKNIDGSRVSFGKLVDQMAAATVQEKLRAKAQERADQLTRTTAERWQSMARNTREFAGNITAATTQLLKWASITGVIGGLIGAGGLFGIDRLALGAASSRRSSLGLGASIGGQEAFKANFGRLVDPESFLASVAAAKYDITKSVGLRANGINPEGGQTEDTAVALLDQLKRIADTTNPALYAQVLQSRRLDQFASPEYLARLHGTSPEEYERLKSQFGQRRGQFDLPGDTARRWQDFVTQLDNAGKNIETIFVKGLVNLAPGLTKLSESVERIAGTMFEKGGTLERWVGNIDVALEKFAGYIGTEEFQNNIRDFVNGIGKIAAAIGGLVSWMGSGGSGGGGAAVMRARLAADRAHLEGRKTRGELRTERAGGRSAVGQLGGILFGGNEISMDQLLGIVRGKEGSGDSAVSPKGAIGRYQIMPGTAQQYGADPSRLADPAYSEATARKILADLAKRYHGNVQEILAAYNGGPGRGDNYRRSGHDPSVLPAETQKYIGGVAGGLRVTVENNTGGNAIVSTNMLKN